MSETMSSSVDDFVELSDDVIISDDNADSETVNKKDPFIDSRRRLEAKLAERQLEKDIQEFNFDF